MLISTRRLLDILFSLAIFSMIIMPNSVVGKGFQLAFVVVNLIHALKNHVGFTKFHFWESYFIIFILAQVIFGIAVMPATTLQMFFTVLYTFLFSWSTYNYIVYRNDLHKVIELYAKACTVAFMVAIILYFKTLLEFRLSASKDITILGFSFFGGSSSTALALQAAIVMFFVVLFPPKGDRKKIYPYIVFFTTVILLTGTRKILVLLIYIIFFVNELLRNKNAKFKVLKIAFALIASFLIGYFVIMKIPFFYNYIGYRVETMYSYFFQSKQGDGSIIVRNRMINSAKNLFYKKPIYGWGMDYFKGSKQNSLGLYSHNNYLELLSGGGIVGLITYYSKYIYTIVTIVKGSANEKISSEIGISCVGFIVIMMVLEYWQVTYFYRYIMIYFAIIIGMMNLKKQIGRR